MLTGKGAPEAERVLPVQQGRDTQEAEREGQDETGQGPSFLAGAAATSVPVPGTLCPSALSAGTAVPFAIELPHDGASA